MMTDHLALAAEDVMAAVLALEPEIKTASAAIEAERRLPPTLAHQSDGGGRVQDGHAARYGGGELDPMSQVRVVEELSRIEGSVGWLSMISTAGSFIPAFLEPPAAQRLFGAVESVRRGAGSPSSARGFRRGRLSIERDLSLRQRMPTCERHHLRMQHLRKWRTSPPWASSGISRAAGARLEGLYRRRMGHDRHARDRQQRHRVDNVFVPFSDSTTMMEKPSSPGPLYSFPPLFLVSHAGVRSGSRATRSTSSRSSSGRRRHSKRPADARRSDDSGNHRIVRGSTRRGAQLRLRTLADLWETLCKGDRPSPRQRAAYRMMMTYSHQAAKQLISTLYDTAATSSIFRSSRLDRDMRDILTACQHRVVHLKMYRPAGRLLLGLDPEEPLF